MMKENSSRTEAQGPGSKPNPFEGRGWIAQGIGFAIILFVLMFLIYPWISGDEITLKSTLVGMLSSLVGGLAYGSIMKWLYKKKFVK